MKPLLSIIVPIYNSEKYITQCIDSLVNQSYLNIEIILVNDGSQDNSGVICDQYKEHDDRIIVIHQTNKGLSGARNAGLDIASGDYIAFVDSDDWVDLDMYTTLLDIIVTHDLDIIECSINTTETSHKTERDAINVKFEDANQALMRIITNTQFSTCTKVFKKSIIKDSRFILNKTSEDVYFSVDNIPKIKKMGFYDVPFYNYRPNPTSITKSPFNLKRFQDVLDACIYLDKQLLPTSNNLNDNHLKHDKLFTTIKNFVLNELVNHYKMLNYYSNLDPQYLHRKKIKKLIRATYLKEESHQMYVKLAKFLPIPIFEIVISLNKFRHNLFKTNQL